MAFLTPLVQNNDFQASICLLRLLNSLGSHSVMRTASKMRHSLDPLLSRWGLFASLLLASMETSVVTGIVPGHHNVLHILVLHCSELAACHQLSNFHTIRK